MAVLGMMLILFTSFSAKADQDGFLDPEKAFVPNATILAPSNRTGSEQTGTEKSGKEQTGTEQDQSVLGLDFKIADGYYMYRERFSFELVSKSNAITLGQAKFPNGKIKFDPTFNKEMELYFHNIRIELPFSVANQNGASGINPLPNQIEIKITGQGCAEAGLCYPPMDFIVKLKKTDDGKAWIVTSNKKSLIERLSNSGWQDVLFSSDDQNLAGILSSTDLLEITILFFVLGALLALTPCVLPMVPILSVLLVGEQHHVSRWRGFALSAAYVAGMSIVYTLLGVAAGLSGAGLAAWLQTPWVLALFAILLATLALAMFDVFQFQMPASIQTKLIVTNSHILGGRLFASLAMGAISALIVGPCVAAPLAGALLYISQTGDVVLGGLALFAMAWGMGVPLLLMGASAGKLMPRTGPWMESVKKFFGLLLFATAWWMVMPVLPTWVQILGWAMLAMLGAMLLRTFEPLPPDSGFGGIVRKTIGMMLVLLSAIWLMGVASGGRSLLQPLSHLAVFAQQSDEFVASEGNNSLVNSTSNTRANIGTNPGTNPSINPSANQSSTKQRLLAPNDVGVKTTQSATAIPSAISKLNLPVIKVGQLQFHRIKTVAQLDAVLAAASQPVMLDFYADWCVSCKEMEAFTFTDAQVKARLNQMLLLQTDVTANDADDRALLKRFRLFGPPGIMFFAKDGTERKDIRVVGFQDANRFAVTLDRVLK